MPKITHIYFDLHNTLIDGVALHPCYSAAYGREMAARYGGDPAAWAEANRVIFADWDSYYADLDLGGDDGIAHMWEGMFRTTRAMFRLTNTPEPPHAELTTLSRQLPGIVTSGCDAVYPDAKPVISQLYRAGYVMGVVSHAIKTQIQGMLTGGGLIHRFNGAIVGPDATNTFRKDETFLRYALLQDSVAPENCLLVDDSPIAIDAARALGMFTAHVQRKTAAESSADVVLRGGLSALPGWLESQQG